MYSSALVVNYLAVSLAAVSTMVVGTLWYLPGVFGRRWMALTGVDPNRPKRPAVVYSLAFLASVLSAWVLAALASSLRAQLDLGSLAAALCTAFFLWLGFTAARLLVHDLFENRPAKVYLINAGHELATSLVMGAIIGVLGV